MSGPTSIPVNVGKEFTRQLLKCLKHLNPHVGFMMCGKGGLNKVRSSAERLEQQLVTSSASAKLNGDFLMLTDGSDSMLYGLSEALANDWRSMKDGLSSKAANARWPPKTPKPIPEGTDKKAMERIERRRAQKTQLRQQHPIVVIGEKYCAYLVQFIRVLTAKELSITAPTFEEFRKMTDVPIGLKTLSGSFLLEIALAKDVWVQRFVANNIAMYCIAGDNVKQIGEEGMDKLVSLAWCPDEEVQISAIMAAFKVVTYKPFHERPPYNAGMDVLKEVAKSSSASQKAIALAVLALSLATGLEAARDAEDLAKKAAAGAQNAIGAVKGLFK